MNASLANATGLVALQRLDRTRGQFDCGFHISYKTAALIAMAAAWCAISVALWLQLVVVRLLLRTNSQLQVLSPVFKRSCSPKAVADCCATARRRRAVVTTVRADASPPGGYATQTKRRRSCTGRRRRKCPAVPDRRRATTTTPSAHCKSKKMGKKQDAGVFVEIEFGMGCLL